VGKTNIALELAFRLQEKSPDCSVFWVQANDAISFENSYREIGRRFQIPRLDDEKADIKQLVRKVMNEVHSPWLMIVDNADDSNVLLKADEKTGQHELLKYLPNSHNGAILFTTRDNKAATDYAETNVITVKEMGDLESKELLTKSLRDQALVEDKASTTRLLELLYNIPLAIKQAAAYLNKNKTTVVKYLSAYEKTNEGIIKLLSIDFEDKGRYRGMKNPIATTWLISFEQIRRQDPLAADYMAFISCIHDQNIPEGLLPSAAPDETIQALGTLQAFGFIHKRLIGESYDMHGLVHLVIQNWLKLMGEWEEWTTKTLRRVHDMFPWPQHENRAMWMTYLPHAQCTVDTFNTGLRRTEKTKKLLAGLLHNLGWCSQIKGQYAEAEGIYRQALQLEEIVLGKDHPNTLGSMNNLAISLHQQGKYAEAEGIHRQTLQLKETVLGKDHRDTLVSMMNLAISLDRQGKYAEAEGIHRQTLQLMETVLGKDHPDTLGGMMNLAISLDRQGKYAEAEGIYQQTLQLMETVLGKDHPETLGGMMSVASSLHRQGKYAEAEGIYQQTLQLKETVLGKDHPDTLGSMMGLAISLDRQGKYTEAEGIHRQTLQLKETVLGKEHPDTLASMNNLAESLRHQAKYAEAEAMQRQTLQLQDTVLGKEHPETLRSMNNLAESLRQQGKYAEAEALHRQ
jgi:tetratricopeptide (TPR) repeat protein